MNDLRWKLNFHFSKATLFHLQKWFVYWYISNSLYCYTEVSWFHLLQNGFTSPKRTLSSSRHLSTLDQKRSKTAHNCKSCIPAWIDLWVCYISRQTQQASLSFAKWNQTAKDLRVGHCLPTPKIYMRKTNTPPPPAKSRTDAVQQGHRKRW